MKRFDDIMHHIAEFYDDEVIGMIMSPEGQVTLYGALILQFVFDCI